MDEQGSIYAPLNYFGENKDDNFLNDIAKCAAVLDNI